MANMEGPLSKWTNMMQGWQYRWFVLDDNAGLLSYYTSREKMTRGVRRGCIRLKGAVVGIDDEDDTTFTVTVDGKVFHLQSKDPEERERWIRALEDTILRHAQLQRKLDPSRPAPTMHDFDQKLAESDAYLQILIDQIKNLELRIENTSDETSKVKLCNIRDHANATLECIKHSIVLLQIAKNTTQPFNGVQIASAVSLKPPSAAGEAARLVRLPEGHKVSADVDSVITVMDSLPVQTGIEVASECLESRTLPVDQNDRAPERSVSSSGFTSRGSLANSIPVTSYSSSEDEDFFDAYEHMGQSPIVPSSHLTFEQSAEYLKPMSLSVEGEKTSGAAAVDYDELYEMDDENDFGSMESHGSVISHLLSQVKIGMDLTKVVLPTFILERRSLLEMYADFFAHPDIFTSITDFSEPRDRMVQVVRWYLSAFHAGRKSEVAKKPYNPILGETFRCWWDVERSQVKNNEKVSDGPIPWCSRDQLTFVAEQVSHHPPVSAFYAEHVEKRISFCAHIWTKSKFLGLSVGVHHIGQGCISLHDYDEEYIVTFPNAYGRSILTVPWVELGGSVNISCAKTGYNANVEFLTKPFYGGKKNRIKADIFQPGERKPFLVVEGEWNGAMTGKWSDGATETFVDVNALKINRKLVQAIAEQNEYDSRRLWREVTAGLAFNDIPRATAAKSFLENRQREEARLRKEQNVDWKTKLFHLVGENWIYNSPLTKRLVLKKPES